MTIAVVCWHDWRFQLGLAANVRLYWGLASELYHSFFPFLQCLLPSTPWLTPGAGTCPTAGGWAVDRRNGTAGANIAPTTPATAGIARRLCHCAILGDSVIFCDLDSTLVALAIVLGGRRRQRILNHSINQSTCSVVKIASSSHRAAVCIC